MGRRVVQQTNKQEEEKNQYPLDNQCLQLRMMMMYLALQ